VIDLNYLKYSNVDVIYLVWINNDFPTGLYNQKYIYTFFFFSIDFYMYIIVRALSSYNCILKSQFVKAVKIC